MKQTATTPVELSRDQQATLTIAARRVAEEQSITRAAAVEQIRQDPALLKAMIRQTEQIGPAAAPLVANLTELLKALHPPRKTDENNKSE